MCYCTFKTGYVNDLWLQKSFLLEWTFTCSFSLWSDYPDKWYFKHFKYKCYWQQVPVILLNHEKRIGRSTHNWNLSRYAIHGSTLIVSGMWMSEMGCCFLAVKRWRPVCPGAHLLCKPFTSTLIHLSSSMWNLSCVFLQQPPSLNLRTPPENSRDPPLSPKTRTHKQMHTT